MNLEVLSPERELFSGEIQSIKLPGVNGQFEVLNNHASLVSALVEGPVIIRLKDGKTANFTITSGFVEILNNKLSLLVQGAEGLLAQED